MAADGLITFDIKTSGDTKSLDILKEQILALSITCANFSVMQQLVNDQFSLQNGSIDAESLLLQSLADKFQINLVIAMQSFILQGDATIQEFGLISDKINQILIPTLDVLLGWISKNMPEIDTTAGEVFRGIKDALGAIATNIEAQVIPQLDKLMEWLGKNSTAMDEKFGIAFNNAKDTVGSLQDSMKKLNAEFDTLVTNSPQIEKSIQGVKDKFEDNDKVGEFLGDMKDIRDTLQDMVFGEFPELPSGPIGIAIKLIELIIKYWPQITEFFSFATRQTQHSQEDYISSASSAYRTGNLDKDLFPAKAEGTPYLPNDMIALVHEGEMIVPKSQNPYAGANRIKSALNVSNADRAAASNNVSNVTYTFNSPKALGMSDVLREMRLAEQRKVLLGV